MPRFWYVRCGPLSAHGVTSWKEALRMALRWLQWLRSEGAGQYAEIRVDKVI
jgi:hypothetical protein